MYKRKNKEIKQEKIVYIGNWPILESELIGRKK